MRKRIGRISPLWEKCARLEQMTLAHTEHAGRVVSATQIARVHKVYSLATDLDQTPARAEIAYSYQNIEYCKMLNIDNSFMSVSNKNMKRVLAKSNP